MSVYRSLAALAVAALVVAGAGYVLAPAAPDPATVSVAALTPTTDTLGSVPDTLPSTTTLPAADTPTPTTAPAPQPTVLPDGAALVPPVVVEPTVPPCQITLDVQQQALVKSPACPTYTFTLSWLHVCEPGLDLPAVLPGGTTITTCPAVLGSTTTAWSATVLSLAPLYAAMPADTNCVRIYVPAADTWLGTC